MGKGLNDTSAKATETTQYAVSPRSSINVID